MIVFAVRKTYRPRARLLLRVPRLDPEPLEPRTYTHIKQISISRWAKISGWVGKRAGNGALNPLTKPHIFSHGAMMLSKYARVTRIPHIEYRFVYFAVRIASSDGMSPKCFSLTANHDSRTRTPRSEMHFVQSHIAFANPFGFFDYICEYVFLLAYSHHRVRARDRARY